MPASTLWVPGRHAGMCRLREKSDAAGGGERGESGEGERWGRGVGGEREEEGVRGEFRGESRYMRENGGRLAREPRCLNYNM
jgi:hypothetical protein